MCMDVRHYLLQGYFHNPENVEFSCFRAIMMGLMLHANAKALIRREQYRDALEVLTMGEVSV